MARRGSYPPRAEGTFKAQNSTNRSARPVQRRKALVSQAGAVLLSEAMRVTALPPAPWRRLMVTCDGAAPATPWSRVRPST